MKSFRLLGVSLLCLAGLGLVLKDQIPVQKWCWKPGNYAETLDVHFASNTDPGALPFFQACSAHSLPSKAISFLWDQFPKLEPKYLTWREVEFCTPCGARSGYEATFIYLYDPKYFDTEFQAMGEVAVEFDEQLEPIEIEYEHVPIEFLPPVVWEAFEKNFPREAEVLNDFELEIQPDGSLFYEFEIRRSFDEDWTFSPYGVLLAENENRCEDCD
ncbi:hypothetical protein [Pontibacter sp. G13]|uniref:hypothetical protein n=1 Tax=Pontibacter sp. G13 TaxID=3074898 RepID=UPI00288C05AD|nr:hypothetical protein [Pontibacter sp. G13]WNJ17993.1 hypothetical protein RJD25_24320 [Pontibacter sp. G13]